MRTIIITFFNFGESHHFILCPDKKKYFLIFVIFFIFFHYKENFFYSCEKNFYICKEKFFIEVSQNGPWIWEKKLEKGALFSNFLGL